MAASFASLPTFNFVNSSKKPLQVRCGSANIREPKQKGSFSSLKECAISLALSVGLIAGAPSIALPPNAYAVANPAIPDVSVLISGPPIKDPGALLRYALPIDNKAIREVQKPLEDITDSLKEIYFSKVRKRKADIWKDQCVSLYIQG